MSKLNKILRLVNEASRRTARIKTLAAKMNTAHEPTPNDYGEALLSANLELAIEHLRTAQEMASYLSRPVKETSRLWKNGSGQYETTAGYCFREGSPIEVFSVPYGIQRPDAQVLNTRVKLNTPVSV